MMAYTIFLLSLLAYESLGTPVALLQETGIFNDQTYLIRRNVDLGRAEIKDFTICAWISLNYLRGQKNHWISIGTDTNEKVLSGSFVNGPEGPRIHMKKYHPRISDEINILLKRFDFQNYHHYCFLFTSQAQFPYPGGYVNLTNKAYVDGNLVNEEMKTIIKSNYEELPRFVNVILGQRYRNTANTFLAEESFSGRIADVLMYRSALTPEMITSLANCKQNTENGNVILDWFVSAYNFVGDVSIEDVSKEAVFCRKPSDLALFNHGLSHDYLKFLCGKLGGFLPTFGQNVSERKSIYDNIKDTFIGAVSKLTCIVNEDLSRSDNELKLSSSIKVLDSDSELYFWTGIKEDTSVSEEVFLNEYTQEPIKWEPDIYPGPLGNFSCTMARGHQYLVKKDCILDTEPCGVCQEIEPQKRLRLKGLCVEDLKADSDFDTEYYVYGLRNDRLYFRGIRSSHIFLDPVDNKWTIQSLKNPGKISKLMNAEDSKMYPIGRQQWKIQNNDTQYGICGLANGQNHVLTLSDCHPNKYTCNTGQCIDLTQKCNGIIDCDDGTDELECQFLVLDKNYSKDKLPLVQNQQDLVKVFLSMTISAYPKIDTANSKVTTDYELSMKWYDPRLIFRDLKADETFNDLTPDNKMIIWSPKVDPINALGLSKGRLDDDSTKIVLLKENEETLPEDFSLSNEARLFSGGKNAVLLTRRFSQDHACNFNLFYYPFDTQVCTMTFELRDKSEDFVQFEKDGEGIKYAGDRNLADYQVLLEDMAISKSETNHSMAIIRVVFKRQTGFHSVTTFTQSMVLILVAFITFFFNIRNFSDRIMVNLLLLLILSTLSSSAQSGVPKTSYYKMIDIWFLFLLILIVLTIIGHTVITLILGPESAENKVFGRKRLFNRRSQSARSQNGSVVEDPDAEDDDNEEMANAKTANLACMGAFLAILVLFNIIFWVYALQEHGSPIENYKINTVKDKEFEVNK